MDNNVLVALYDDLDQLNKQLDQLNILISNTSVLDSIYPALQIQKNVLCITIKALTVISPGYVRIL